MIVVINMAHPHLSTVDENGLLNYFRDCITTVSPSGGRATSSQPSNQVLSAA